MLLGQRNLSEYLPLRLYFFIAGPIAQVAWLIWIALAGQRGQTMQQ